MATNNPIDSFDPIQVALGGQGNATLTPQYGVLYGNGTSAVGVTTVGTAGQILASGNGSTAPFWIPHTGQLVEVNYQVSSSGGASINFTTGISNTYNTYLLILGFPFTSTGDFDQMQFSTNGGSTWINSGYFSGLFTWNNGSSLWSNVNTTSAFDITTTSATEGRTVIWLYGLTTGANPMITFTYYSGAVGGTPASFGGGVMSTGNINAIKIFLHNGASYTAYEATLYGLKES